MNKKEYITPEMLLVDIDPNGVVMTSIWADDEDDEEVEDIEGDASKRRRDPIFGRGSLWE